MMTPWQVNGTQHDEDFKAHELPSATHELSHVPPVVVPVLAQAPEQQAALLLHDAAIGRQALPSEPASGVVIVQQELSGCPQLSVQLPAQPVLVQQVFALVQVAPPEHPHDCAMPQESATETLHWFPQLLVGVQHAPFEPHSWPFEQPPVHSTVSPQLSRALPLHMPLQGDWGVQQAPW